MGPPDHMKVLKRLPTSKPPFELSDLKRAIPPHCFELLILRSFRSLFRELFLICTLYYLASNNIPLLPQPLKYIAWPLYWFFQGLILGSLWSLTHEISHGAFSGYQWLDDTIGFIIHSALLTPYYSMKYSHRNHHANTNSVEYDVIHVPKLKSHRLYSKILNNPIGVVLKILFDITFGWNLYLLFNYTGRKYEGIASHFYPQSPMYTDSERRLILLSNVGIFVSLYAYYNIVVTKGLMWTIYMCGAPLLVMCSVLMVLTYLQHTHLSIAHYDSTEWDWIRGALSTVDRDVGILNWLVHDVPRNHVLHHLFPRIPHYHANEATKAIKPILGDYYKYDDTPVVKAFWREMKECIYVEPDDGHKSGVYWFKNKA
ncbi:hypothetical protein M8C21_008787 [Ambrosia artemisiifolia]|uniref:Fatty acid desaturase domain-containing protein n=1 Tax=Ambrosia artemisiifolia TaxID=4212 RepID=A0AAD5BT76_AMBAR|nr:hypothetical protein M8C21_008787 [Ambrosia artemisiifolia]